MPKRSLHVVLLCDAPDDTRPSIPFPWGLLERSHHGRSVARALSRLGHHVDVLGWHPQASVDLLRWLQPDLVFNLVEAIGGDRSRDCEVPAALECLGLPYTGSCSSTLRVCRDKAVSKQVVQDMGLAVPRYFVVEPGAALPRRLAFPLIVKPIGGDASEHISLRSIVHTRTALAARVRKLHEWTRAAAICEEYVPGQELYVGVISEGGRALACQPRELDFGTLRQRVRYPVASDRLKHDAAFRDRHSICLRVPRLPHAVVQHVSQEAVQIFEALAIRDYGRMDFRLNASAMPVFLEANANAGLLPSKPGRPNVWGGVPYGKLVDAIVQSALRRSPRVASRSFSSHLNS
jgi:D-alanine-D-alanine ligase